MAGYDPRLPTWALQQVGGYSGYTGRDANIVPVAALDLNPPVSSAYGSRTSASEQFTVNFDYFFGSTISKFGLNVSNSENSSPALPASPITLIWPD